MPNMVHYFNVKDRFAAFVAVGEEERVRKDRQ
jgi:hypothetical protein